jgi:hypothetical protein
LQGYVFDADGNNRGVPADATVEVLASPVYVNSDTVEWRNGDIARHADGCTFVRAAGHWINARTGIPVSASTLETEPLTLLVRDGEVVR